MSAATSHLPIHTLNLIPCLPPQWETEGNKTRLMAGSWDILLNPEDKWVCFFLFSMCSMLSSWMSVTQHIFDAETDFMGKAWYDSTGELTNSQRVNCSHSLRWQWDAGCSTSLNKHGSEPRVRCGSELYVYKNTWVWFFLIHSLNFLDFSLTFNWSPPFSSWSRCLSAFVWSSHASTKGAHLKSQFNTRMHLQDLWDHNYFRVSHSPKRNSHKSITETRSLKVTNSETVKYRRRVVSDINIATNNYLLCRDAVE